MLQRGLLNIPSDPDLAQDTAQWALAGGRLEVWGLWTPRGEAATSPLGSTIRT